MNTIPNYNGIKDSSAHISHMLSRVRVASEENTVRKKYWDASITFLLITNAENSEFEVLKTIAPQGNVKTEVTSNLHGVVSLAYINHPEVSKKHREVFLFVIGRWEDERWLVVSENEDFCQDEEYLVVMTMKEYQKWRINGAIYALRGKSAANTQEKTNNPDSVQNFIEKPFTGCQADVSILVTNIFARTCVYDTQWKRIKNKLEVGFGGHFGQDRGTYLEAVKQNLKDMNYIFFTAPSEAMRVKNIIDMVTEKDGSIRQLNDVYVGGVFPECRIQSISDHDFIKVSLKTTSNKYTKTVFALKNSKANGMYRLQLFDGVNVDCATVSKISEDKFEGVESQNLEGEAVHHFFYSNNSVTLHVEKSTELMSLIPELAAIFDVSIIKLGSRYVKMYDNGGIVDRHIADVKTLKEFGAYLFED